jgi:predicted nucleic-acid-binding Zn-ribbon protein
MKNGQCPKCGSHEVFSNTNRKFPALNTMTIGSGNFGNRYAYLDTYVCVRCGYVENYVAKQADLNYIEEEWTCVKEDNNQVRDSSSEDSVSLGFASL